MMANVDIQVLNRLSVMLLPVLLMTLVKSALFFIIVAVLIRVFRLTSAGVRYVLWASVVFFVLFIAIYTVIYPNIHVASLRISIRSPEKNYVLSNLLLSQHDTWLPAKDYVIESSTSLQDDLTLTSESFHWAFWVVFVWIAGSVLCLLYTLTGRIGVRYIFRKAFTSARSELITMIDQHAFDLGITMEIKVIVSRKCRLPFTYGLIHPVLVVPRELMDWPVRKLRAVIIHELTHIQRHDYFVLLFSRLVCIVFWFIPVVWIAHARLQLEQENLCDLMAIQRGERPTVYARYMVDLARTARSLVLWSAIFIIKGRKNMLEKRVTNILNLKGSNLQGGGFTMKIRTPMTILILITAVLMIAGSCATEKKLTAEKEFYLPKYDEELYGTWINEEYNSLSYKGKKRLYPWGYYEDYRPFDSEVVQYKATFVIVDKWTDSEGNIWYKTYYRISGATTIYHELDKISNNGNTWEYAYTSVDFPSASELNPDNTRYRIYYRQE